MSLILWSNAPAAINALLPTFSLAKAPIPGFS